MANHAIYSTRWDVTLCAQQWYVVLVRKIGDDSTQAHSDSAAITGAIHRHACFDRAWQNGGDSSSTAVLIKILRARNESDHVSPFLAHLIPLANISITSVATYSSFHSTQVRGGLPPSRVQKQAFQLSANTRRATRPRCGKPRLTRMDLFFHDLHSAGMQLPSDESRRKAA